MQITARSPQAQSAQSGQDAENVGLRVAGGDTGRGHDGNGHTPQKLTAARVAAPECAPRGADSKAWLSTHAHSSRPRAGST